MQVGVVKEVKDQENRVALTPSGAQSLILKGHHICVQDGAGLGAGFADDGAPGNVHTR